LKDKFVRVGAGPVDVFAFDIQRGLSLRISSLTCKLTKTVFLGRDAGLPTWLQTREKCGLQANFTTFKDLRKVLCKTNVKLLEANYDFVKDIDLYVGGGLESFEVMDKVILGPTFSCLSRDQYHRMSSGDSYFYSHADSPNAFSAPQLKAISDFSVNSLVCSTTTLSEVNKNWIYVDDASNPKVPCSSFPKFNLQPWIDSKQG
jgi:hypothetical protein